MTPPGSFPPPPLRVTLHVPGVDPELELELEDEDDVPDVPLEDALLVDVPDVPLEDEDDVPDVPLEDALLDVDDVPLSSAPASGSLSSPGSGAP